MSAAIIGIADNLLNQEHFRIGAYRGTDTLTDTKVEFWNKSQFNFWENGEIDLKNRRKWEYITKYGTLLLSLILSCRYIRK